MAAGHLGARIEIVQPSNSVRAFSRPGSAVVHREELTWPLAGVPRKRRRGISTMCLENFLRLSQCFEREKTSLCTTLFYSQGPREESVSEGMNSGLRILLPT